jgi:hypothetical protein
MRGRIIAAAVWALLANACPARGATVPDLTPALEKYLRGIGLDAGQLSEAARGRAVVSRLATESDRDVAVFGMIGVRAPRDSVLAHVLDLERFLATKGRRFHVFGDPPTISDVREVTFAESEYRDLKECHPGDCDFKLPASAMEAFRQIDWSSRDAKAQVDEQLRRGVLDLVTNYRKIGNSGTLIYDDVHGVRSGDVFLDLVTQIPVLYEYPPELERYLKTYPDGRPERARDYLYWSEDRLKGLRPTLTVNHMVVYDPATSASSTAFVAWKQIYATHYYEGAFELLAVVEAGGSGGEPITYLITVRRVRFDLLPRGLLNIRGRVRSKLQNAMRSSLEHYRSAIEEAK